MNTTKTITVPSTVDSLMGAYRSHVLGRTLPAPASVDIVTGAREIFVQPGSGPNLCSVLGNLLVWAYTLVDVTAQWWHTDSDSLHITITGRTAGGTRMKVYSGATFTDSLGLVPLARGEREGVSLDELYTLLGLLREDQHEAEPAREVA
jgi:hypothetical protein